MIALLAEAALRSFLLGVAVWLAVRLLRPRNPHLQKTVWLTVLLASIAMPFALKWQLAPSFEAPAYLIFGQGGTVIASGARSGAPAAAAALGSWPMRGLTLAYSAIAFVLLVRFTFGLIGIWRIRRDSIPLASGAAQFDTRLTAKVRSPATFGSTILLPADAAGWRQEKLAAVLSHERSHVRHKDCYVQWIARLHAAVFWFNPFAWWLDRHLAELAETTSDDAVIESIADRTAYAQLLLDIARQPTPGRVVMSAAHPNLSARIERIVSNVPPAAPPRRWVRVLAVALLIPPIAIAAATIDPPAASPAKPQSTAVVARAAEAPALPPFGRGGLKLLRPVNPDDFYPAAAVINGIDGSVVLEVTIDQAGGLVDAKVISEEPSVDKGWGFGPAAVVVAQRSSYSNSTGHAARMRFKVKFVAEAAKVAKAAEQLEPVVVADTRSTPPAAAGQPAGK